MKTPKERRDIARKGALELHANGGPNSIFKKDTARQAAVKRWTLHKLKLQRANEVS
jgi:hypothetical protein